MLRFLLDSLQNLASHGMASSTIIVLLVCFCSMAWHEACTSRNTGSGETSRRKVIANLAPASRYAETSESLRSLVWLRVERPHLHRLDFGILIWPTSALCFGPPPKRTHTLSSGSTRSEGT